MEQVRTKSVEPQQRFTLAEVNWEDLNEAGAYVERGSGDLYRIPKEALIPASHYSVTLCAVNQPSKMATLLGSMKVNLIPIPSPLSE